MFAKDAPSLLTDFDLEGSTSSAASPGQIVYNAAIGHARWISLNASGVVPTQAIKYTVMLEDWTGREYPLILQPGERFSMKLTYVDANFVGSR